MHPVIANLARQKLALLNEAHMLQQELDARRSRTEGKKHQHYAATPADWLRECIDWPPGTGYAPYQSRALTMLAEHGRLAVRGPRGMGKTTTDALTVLWFATTRSALGLDWKILTTAGTHRHLSENLWPEIHQWSRRLTGIYKPLILDKELLKATIYLPHGHAYSAVAARPDFIEGAHADELLVLIDEAKAVGDTIFHALEGTLTGETGQYVLATSTPGPPAGMFYDIARGRADGWATLHVTIEDAISAGRVSQKSVDNRAKLFGADSAVYRQQVLGDFAADDENAVIPLAWVEASTCNDAAETTGKHILGVDVAAGGADSSVIAERWGNTITKLHTLQGQNTTALIAKIQELATPETVIVIDVAGVGAGVGDRADELGLNVRKYTGAAGSKRKDATGIYGFANTRAAAYWHLRELLDPQNDACISLPESSLLVADLTTPTMREPATGTPPKRRMEQKDQLVARMGRSPDTGDAVVMAFWADTLVARSMRIANRGGVASPMARAGRR